MKLKTTKSKINECLPITSLCANDGIYSLLYVKAEEELTLGAGNMDAAQMFVSLDADIEETGKILVDAKLLKAIWPSIPDGEISLQTKGGKLFITQGEDKWSVSIGNAEDYPLISQEAKEESTISLVELASAVNMVSFAVSGESGRPALNAINLHKGTFTATDGIKLGQVTTAMTGLDITFSSSVQQVTKIFTKVTKSDELSFGQGATWVRIKSKNVEAWLATVGLDYPETAIEMIRKMQSQPPEAVAFLDVPKIRPLIQAAVALDNKANRCDGLVLGIEDSLLTVSLEGDSGSLEKDIPLEGEGVGKVWLNPAEFEDLLRASPTDTLEIRIYSGKRPLIGLANNLPWGCALAVLEPVVEAKEEEEHETDF